MSFKSNEFQKENQCRKLSKQLSNICFVISEMLNVY